MRTMDRVIAAMALLTFIGFCGVLVYFVPEIDLVIVLIGVIAMAAYDFWLAYVRRGPSPSGRN